MRCSCTKHGRKFCLWCLAQSAAFPVEHLVWERAPVFSAVTRWLGL